MKMFVIELSTNRSLLFPAGICGMSPNPRFAKYFSALVNCSTEYGLLIMKQFWEIL